ncbi:pro-opiomelanocortin [Rhineura floridana]|uniref:pro-opiomelanocortin n=1 Tax=Rhineura floridana TaxID=261503 RepID=UPI002AC872B0|nr:pro-opiomelanocortin [Rhineura floridana]
MLNPQWSSLLATVSVLLVHLIGGVPGHCLDSSWCRDMDKKAEVMDCLRACRLDLSDESPVIPGNGHMQPLSENIRKYVMSHFRWNKFGNGSDVGHKREELSRDSTLDVLPASSLAQDSLEIDRQSHQESSERQDGKRSYAMEHFRWGKPVGRKRRPVKVYPTVEEEAVENYPQEFRRDLSWETDPELGSPEEKKAAMSEEEDQPPAEEAKKDNGQYKMHHFRWNVPAPPLPKKKRYGGFMTSERSHMPLVTLFKNAIVKTAYKKGQ